MTSRNRADRRKKTRIRLTRGLIARYGVTPAVILDVTDAGARIEHFVQLDVGRKARLRFEWDGHVIEVEATVVSCRVHRFAQGDDGSTVYQSGLFFHEYIGEAAAVLRERVEQHVARSLAEQVANARGIGPVTERNMPVFRSGVVATNGIDATPEETARLIPSAAVVADRGYVRCTLIGTRWQKIWTRVADQPEEGFTVLASEPAEHIEQLCESYQRAGADERHFIRVLAEMSLEPTDDTPEPI